MTFFADEMLSRVRKALEAELTHLSAQHHVQDALPRVALPPSNSRPIPRLAVVATDAGNLELRLHPLCVGVVRIATSDPQLPVGEVFVPLSATPAEQLQWVFAEASMKPLREAAVRCGLDHGVTGRDVRSLSKSRNGSASRRQPQLLH